MSGLTFALDIKGVPAVTGMLGRLARLDIEELAFNVGALLESSTKRRIADEKTAPDGTPWEPWSEDYAATRSGGHSLLMSEGDLLDDVQNRSEGDEARVGTSLVYGAIHQFSGEEVGMNIPARPYLGLSDRDRDDIDDLAVGELREIVQ